jgi:excisionase family DNA binding protein
MLKLVVASKEDISMAALTTEQVAKRLNTTERTIRRMLNDKRLKGFRLGPRVWRVEEADLEKFIEEQKRLAQAG